MHYLSPPDNNDETMNESTNNDVIDDEIHDIYEDTDNNDHQSQVIDKEYLSNYVTTNDETELSIDDTEMMQTEGDNVNQDFFIPADFIPTTNAAEVAMEVEEKVKYGF